MPPSGPPMLLWLAALESGFLTFVVGLAALAVGVWLFLRTDDIYWLALGIPVYALRFIDQQRAISERQRRIGQWWSRRSGR